MHGFCRGQEMEMQNQKTVVGVFDDYNAAQDTQNELIRIGIPKESINITSDSPSAMAMAKPSKRKAKTASPAGSTRFSAATTTQRWRRATIKKPCAEVV
jgi:hypothetical protein